jgi:cytochrome b561
MILILAVVRLATRMLTTLPPFPPTMTEREQRIASMSEKLLYTLMIALPLVGWGMLSAGNFPVVMVGPVHLPHILPASPVLYAVLRTTHTILAFLLFFTVLAHLAAVLFHTFIVGDGLLSRMAVWRVRPADTTFAEATLEPINVNLPPPGPSGPIDPPTDKPEK